MRSNARAHRPQQKRGKVRMIRRLGFLACDTARFGTTDRGWKRRTLCRLRLRLRRRTTAAALAGMALAAVPFTSLALTSLPFASLPFAALAARLVAAAA